MDVSSFSKTLEADLRGIVKGECHFDLPTRERYSRDESWYRITPIAVVHPTGPDDVAALARYCHEREIPLVPRGGASGLAGQAIGMGIIIDFTHHMNRILETGPETVRVQPGVILNDLNEHLKPTGRFLSIDPASGDRCTIGGMTATNAAGAHGVKYGSMKRVIRQLKVVLANGETAVLGEPQDSPTPFFEQIKSILSPLLSGQRDLIQRRFPDVPKNSSGYNLKDAVGRKGIDFLKILVGSEGTLGIIVEATLRTSPLPAHRIGALAYYSTYEKAVDATIIGLDQNPSAIEILDGTYVALVKGTDPKVDALIVPEAKAMLYFEFEGPTRDDVEKSLMLLNRALSITLPIKLELLTREEDVARIWKMRADASAIINTQKSRGKTSFVEDVAVPLPALPAYVKGLRGILQDNEIEFSIYGHAGTGNIHCAAFVDLGNLEHYKAIDVVASEVYALARSLGGTHSGEHGDGFVRTPFLQDLYGPEIYELFRKIKQTFDPKNILNPGKIVGQQNASILHDLDLA